MALTCGTVISANNGSQGARTGVSDTGFETVAGDTSLKQWNVDMAAVTQRMQ